jgi:predicted small lipoprotein YifL
MKQIFLSIAIVGALCTLQSCGSGTAALPDQAAIDTKVNAAADAKIQELTGKATAECETRMATEVKQMADSIVHTTQMQRAGGN